MSKKQVILSSILQTGKKLDVVLICLVLALATFIAYGQLQRNGFIDYDDAAYVTENPQVKAGITRESVVWAFTSSHVGNWHPLTSLSHMLDCELFGLNPLWHHMTSLLFHVLNSLLLFSVLKKTSGATWASAFVAAAFAMHPLHVESVAWVAERKDVLSGFFWMLTMAAYVRYTERPRIGRYLVVVLAFCLGLMAKPMLVTLPFVLLLLDYWPLGRFQWARQIGLKTARRSELMIVNYKGATLQRIVCEKVPLFVLSAVSSIVTFLVQRSAAAVAGTDVISIDLRIANTFVSYVRYIGKTIWPTRLAVFYPHLRDSLPMWQAVCAALLVVAITAGTIWRARRECWLPVGWLWYLGTLVPVIGLVQVGAQAMADRYTYIPVIGLFIIIAWGLPELTARLPYKNIILRGMGVGVVLAMMVCTWRQVGYWQNSYTLFEHALDVTSNNYVAHRGLGTVLFKQGRFEEAISHYKETLRNKPHHANTLGDLGLALLQLERYDEAVRHFHRALEGKGDTQKWYRGLGTALYRLGRPEEAIVQYRQALKLDANNEMVHKSLAIALVQVGEAEEAVEHFTEALRLKPDYLDARVHLVYALVELGGIESAVEHCQEILRFKPNQVEALNALAWIWATTDNTKFQKPIYAVELARRACELTNYENTGLLDTLAAAYAAAGRFPEAVEVAEKVLRSAQSSDQEELTEVFQSRLLLYKAGRPYREPSPLDEDTSP
jgi:tetratricopeptide (TPR) repeat protein